MAKRAHARRYSQAVFDMALEAGELDKWQADLEKIAALVGDSTVAAFLVSPKIHFGEKTKLLARQLAGVNPLALNLVYLLIAKDRLNLISEIVEDYQQLLDSYRGIEPAEVVTAVPLSEEEKLKLTERLSGIIGKKVTLKTRVNPDIIGGVIARIGGKLLDGSTRSKLEALKKEMAGARR